METTDNNKELELAYRLIEETGINIFLTGKAGTGKTTFLRKLKTTSQKRMVVLAPTGIAAINAGGMTIHSFFQLPFSPFVPGYEAQTSKSFFKLSKEKLKIIKTIDLLVIDEISMVRSDLLDAVDNSLRKLRDPYKPFGGVQMHLIGDLQQLPPVVTEAEKNIFETYYSSPYFFSSKAFQSTPYVTIELKKVYRQSNQNFLNILNRIRDNSADKSVLDELNKRFIPNFIPAKDEEFIRLTTHNNLAFRINRDMLSRIDSPSYFFYADITGDFPENSYPNDHTLELKEGAQIMFLKNDPMKRFFNGMLGVVTSIDEKNISVRNADGLNFMLERETWENMKYSLNDKSGQLEEQSQGSFTQYPVKLAWAITIHKSQGLTFEKAIIDASHSFAHGQAYVALSRCKSLEGLVLEAPLNASSIICDSDVTLFSNMQKKNAPDPEQFNNMKKAYKLQMASDLFNLSTLRTSLSSLRRVVEEFVQDTYPSAGNKIRKAVECFDKIAPVTEKFIMQCRSIISQPDSTENDDFLNSRIKAACNYFLPELSEIKELVESISSVEIDNSFAAKRLDKGLTDTDYLLRMHIALLNGIINIGFSTENILRIKKEFILSNEKENTSKTKKKTSKVSATKTVATEDVDHPILFDRLRLWRYNTSKRQNLAAYQVLSTKSLVEIANKLPSSRAELLSISGIGNVKITQFGDDILAIVNAYLDND